MFLLTVSGFISLKRGLLFAYNLVQFLGFSWIFVNMTVRLFIFGRGEETEHCWGSTIQISSPFLINVLSHLRFCVRYISHHIGRDVLLPDPGSGGGPQRCFWFCPDRRYSNSYTGMGFHVQ